MTSRLIAANVNWLMADIQFTLGHTPETLDYLQAFGEEMVTANRAYLAITAISRESYEAVRFGDLDRALEHRLQSTALYRGRPRMLAYYGWDAWELGELYRVRGELTKAEQWYECRPPAVPATEIMSHGQAFFLRGMGDLSMMQRAIR